MSQEAALVQLRSGSRTQPRGGAAMPAPQGDPLVHALVDALGDPARVLTRAIDLAAHAGDASVYHLVPRAVVRPASEAHVQALFRVSHAHAVPLTFRAAGTSLSGQAVTDGILVDLSHDWGRVEPEDGGRRVRVQPGAIGGRVNAVLRRHARRIGPDPASIDACMMGGILANNASGMCCGVAENAYHTLHAMRVVLPDGTVVDTSEADADARFAAQAPALHRGLAELRARVLADAPLVERIRAKYRIKNTTGYGLNAFLDFDTPARLLAQLMIGSEGTLGFIAEATLRTLPDLPAKLTGLLLFESAAAAFAAVAPFAASGARAIEFLDDACLHAVADQPALGVDVRTLPAGAAALLVEYQEETDAGLASARVALDGVLARVVPLVPPRFHDEAGARAGLWKVRKGVYPAAGATRRPGETVIIEDVAFPPARLPAATAALQALFAAHGYDRALLFGHAKDGNCHFVITPAFGEAAEVARYQRFMTDLVALVVGEGGSLKAEHGTGRNMAPFVADEWGDQAVAVMRALKALVDPRGLLNPGVILNDDPRAHVAHLKSLPAIDAETDRCVECGFCEPQCPSRRLTLTPRQRIAVRREMARAGVAAAGALAHDFQYDGIDTCAADGMCATVCPVGIDTGRLVKRLRREQRSPRGRRVAALLARHFGALERVLRLATRAGHVVERLFGVAFIVALTRACEWLVGTRLPRWSRAIPRVPARAPARDDDAVRAAAAAVLVPSCMTRMLGLPRSQARSAEQVLLELAARAGVPVLLPRDRAGTCCGLAFGSKGHADAHVQLLTRLVDRMWSWSRAGALPLVLDSSSCLYGIHDAAATGLLTGEAQRRLAALHLVDAAAFVRDVLLPRLPVTPVSERVVLHPTCAARKLDGGAALRAVAQRCAVHAEVPLDLGCCAMAGDRGLMYPELTASAVAPERAELLAGGGQPACYANNLACEMGMTQATGVPYVSFLYLVEKATRGPEN